MTPSLRDAQVAKLIAENERLREALKEMVEFGERQGWYHVAINQARAALAEEQGE